MSQETSKDLVLSLDRRLGEHELKLSNIQKGSVELSQEIKQLLERINNGVSPSVNKVLHENGEIKLSISNLSHKMEIDMIEMKQMVRETTDHTRLMLDNWDKHKLAPVTAEMGFIKKTFVYGLVGALLVFLGQKGINVLWDKVFSRNVVVGEIK